MAFLFKKVNLLNGNSAPFTGEYVSTATARNLLFNFYASGVISGNSLLALQFQSPFFPQDSITFHAITGLSGYGSPLFSDSPISEVRAVCSGTGNYWVSVNMQN